MNKKQSNSKRALVMVAIFVSMLVIQSCGGSKYGCPTDISKAKAKQEARG